MFCIDLSTPIVEKSQDPQAAAITWLNHEDGAIHVEADPFFQADAGEGQVPKYPLTRHSFPDQAFLSYETVSTSVHTGSHMDAPYHYGPICEGRPARTIGEVPLEDCVGPGLVLDVRAVQAGDTITVADLRTAAKLNRQQPEPGTIVLLHTGAGRLWGTPQYFRQHPGVGVDALAWLIDRGVKTIGIDAFSFDRPFQAMIAAYHRDGNPNHLWPAHFYGRRREYFQLEGLANLEGLPAQEGFQLCCFPINIRGAGAGWVRPVAIFP